MPDLGEEQRDLLIRDRIHRTFGVLLAPNSQKTINRVEEDVFKLIKEFSSPCSLSVEEVKGLATIVDEIEKKTAKIRGQLALVLTKTTETAVS